MHSADLRLITYSSCVYYVFKCELRNGKTPLYILDIISFFGAFPTAL